MAKPRLRGFTIIALFVIASLLIATFFPYRKHLTQRATRMNMEQNSLWLSDHKVLFFRYLGPTPKGYHYIPTVRDLSTGVDKPLSELMRCFEDSKGMFNHVHVSPTSRWLLWQIPGSKLKVATLSGSKHYEQPYNGRYVGWKSDSEQWVEFCPSSSTQSARVTIHQVVAPQETESIPLSTNNPLVAFDQSAHTVFIWSNKYRVVSWSIGDEINKEAAISDYSFTANAMPGRRLFVRLPEGAHIEDVIFSPNGRRIAWVLKLHTISPISVLLHKFYPPHKPEARESTGIWVSQADGRGLSEVGCEETDTGKPEFADETPAPIFDLQWLPDGKRLSFGYNRSMWTVPAE